MVFRSVSGVLFLLIMALSACFTASAKVRTVSLERNVVENGKRYYEVSLKCTGDPESRDIRRPARAAKWCSVDVEDLCYSSKYALARNICKHDAGSFAALGKPAATDQSPEPTDQITESGVVQGAEQESETQRVADLKKELLLEQILIEEQRIQLEQRRLELVKRELSLKKSLTSRAGNGN